ncbi:PucR family transcriptional regulator [Wohlfahrtiimonas larvae]|uniref:PucR family transcriptional regulator n=1 Tax=Wohlfahrtiimonas larvae TaxID=1157986 RepID=A0ABP9MH66_9GAMM|nr:PucR family transcriptional regulator [Wohlfahrtiimonas larvae]
MQLTIRNLINMPALKIKLLSENKGIDRKIVWAHTSELENPSEWVQPNYLIMTTGLGIPKTPEKQKDYIKRIIDADLSGLMISDNMSAPDDLSTLIEVANQYKFPVLFIDYHTPFIEIARIVHEANKDNKDLINHQLSKVLYENTQELIKEHNVKDLMVRIHNLLNMPVYLINTDDPTETLFNCTPVPESIQSRLLDFDFKTTDIQKIYQKSSTTLHTIPLKAQGFMLIVADNTISLDLLQNLALLFSLYLESKKDHFYQRIIQSGELLDDILNEGVNENYIDKKLPSFHINISHCCIFIAKLQKNINYKKLLFKFSINGLVLFKKDRVILLADKSHLTKLITIFPFIGISDAIQKTHRIHNAFREASLAFKNCSKEFPTQYYAEQNYSNQTLPKSIEEAQKIFDLNLGKLYTNDQSKNTRYIYTLKMFLENDRAWEKTAKILHIHKQTLVYRIQKIQEITQRQLNITADIVELWIALKAGEILGVIEE